MDTVTLAQLYLDFVRTYKAWAEKPRPLYLVGEFADHFQQVQVSREIATFRSKEWREYVDARNEYLDVLYCRNMPPEPPSAA